MAGTRGTTGGRESKATRNEAKKVQRIVSAEERRRMIAEAAYYRAQARGFRGGDPRDDWSAAEAEIDRTLTSSDQVQAEQAAYERLRAEVQKGLAAVRGSVDAKTVQEAVERAAERVKKAGEHAAGTINKAADGLKKEIAEAAAAMGPRWEAFSDKTASVFAVWRDRGGAFLARAAIGVGDWLEQTGRRLDPVRYRSGDIVGAGNFECLQCREVVRLEASGHLAPCGKCGHVEFRRLEA